MRKILLRAAVSLAFLVLLFYLVREDVPLILHTLKNMKRGLAAFSVLIFLSTIAVMAFRLRLIFRIKGVPISLAEASNLTLVGYFFNNFLPTSVGGDIVKALCAARVTRNTVCSVTGVLMDRMFGLFTFILIPSLTMIFAMKTIHNPLVPVVIYGLLAASCAVFLLIFNRRLARKLQFIQSFGRFGEKLRQLYEGLHDFKNHKKAIAYAMGLSVLGQSVSIFVLYLMALALGAKTSLAHFFLLVPIVHLVSMVPSLNGLGPREWAYIYFLKPYVGKEVAAALGILWLGLLILLSVIGGMIYLIRHDYHIRFKQAVFQEEIQA